MRNKSSDDKKREVLQRTLEGIQRSSDILNINNDPETGLPYGFPMEEVIGLFDYFENQPVYTMDMPIVNVPHPEPNRRLVDPELEGVPSHITVQTRHNMIESFYSLTEHFNRLIEDGFEIFIYTLTPSPLLYNPVTFYPERRWGIRYGVVDTRRWYETNPIYREPHEMESTASFGPPLTTEQTFKEEDIVINKSRFKYKHKFK